jgi:hypothetical protein
MTNSLLIYGEIFAHFLINEENFIFFFISETTSWQEGGRGWLEGDEPNHTMARKPGPL